MLSVTFYHSTLCCCPTTHDNTQLIKYEDDASSLISNLILSLIVHCCSRAVCTLTSFSMMQHITQAEQGRRKYLALFPFQLSSPPSSFYSLYLESTVSQAWVPRNHYRWHISWVRPVAQCPDFPLWHYIKESTKWDEDNKVTSAVHTLLSHVDEPGGRGCVTHAFPQWTATCLNQDSWYMS